MKRKLIILFILLSGLSCVSQTKSDTFDLVGTWKYNVGYFEYTLVIKPDSTYEYSFVGDLNYGKSEGKWERKGNKLILNSYKQKPVESNIISKYSDTIAGVTFIIKDISGKPIAMPHIKITTSQITIDTLITNLNGVFRFAGIKNIQEFKISFIGLKPIVWISKTNKNYFEVVMAPEYDDYIYQINEIWKIKGNRLYSPSGKKDDRVFKEKDRTNSYLKEQK